MLIEVEHLQKRFENGTMPLRDVSCQISEGEVISILGPSGTGKSTFLNLLNRLDQPSGGKILFEGQDILAKNYDCNALRRRMGTVFQSFNLFSHLTIVENLMLGPTRLLKKNRQAAYDKALELLDTVGLSDKASSYPAELSGGQQQRAAIVRAMAMDPKVLLFDEPTSSLDPTMVGEVLNVIRNLAQTGMTMLIVTHEMSFARNVSSRIFYMDEGIIYEDGTPEQIFEAPLKEKTLQFIHRLKAYNRHINFGSLDFEGLHTEIMRFIVRNMISPVLAHRMEVLFEELCVQIVLFGLKPAGGVDFSFLYSEEENSVEMDITWKGDRQNPLTQADPIPLALVKANTEELQYTCTEGTNQIRTVIFGNTHDGV